MESLSSLYFDPNHPLAGDRQRLDKVVDNMFRKIQKTLYRKSIGRSLASNELLEGGAITANEILAEALADLLEFPPERLEETWEALAVRIAHHKAVDALRASQKGLRETEHREPLRLLSGDAERIGPDGETQEPILTVLPGDWDGPEVECEQLERVGIFFDLAWTVLDEREREIVFAILKGSSRKEVGEQHDLSGQRVGQIFTGAMNRLATDPNNPFTSEDLQGGKDQ